MTMDDQYPKLVVESQLARRRLAQAFESGADSEIKHQFLPVSDRTLATVAQKNHHGGTFAKQPGTTKRGINCFSFILILLLLNEITASQTDNPAFWLFVGAISPALAFAANRLLQYRSTRNGSGKTISQE
jgi:hypothetical protein